MSKNVRGWRLLLALALVSGCVDEVGARVPNAPTNVIATPGVKAINVRWSAPADDGGSTILRYTVTPYFDTIAGRPVVVDGSQPQATITPLTTGATYTVTVFASNGVGDGPESSRSGPVVPQ